MNWQRITTGGKPYFYTAKDARGLWTVVWNRLYRKWATYHSKDDYTHLTRSARAGMALADTLAIRTYR